MLNSIDQEFRIAIEMDDRLAGLGIGADAYFSKPVNISELVITLTNLGHRLR